MDNTNQRKPRLVENLWDCPYCGNKGIKGREEICPQCSTRREGGIEFYRNEINYVSDDTAKNISRNPDWCCSYCGGLNPDTVNICGTCSAPRDNQEKTYFEELKEEKEDQLEEQTIMNSYSNVQPIETKEPIQGVKQMKKGISQLFKGFAVFGILAAIVALLCFIFIPKEKTITIEDFSWERSIAIQEMNTYDEEGWSLPSGARKTYSEERIKSYDKVIDYYETKTENVTKERIAYYEDYVSGYKDLGNGYSEEIISQRPVYETYTEQVTTQIPVYKEVPVYATYYFYEIDRWETIRTIDTQGYDQNPYWGEVTLRTDERKGSSSENYYIHFKNEDNKIQKYSINQSSWSNLEKGQTLKVKVSFGKIVEIIGIESNIEQNNIVSFEQNNNIYEKKLVA